MASRLEEKLERADEAGGTSNVVMAFDVTVVSWIVRVTGRRRYFQQLEVSRLCKKEDMSLVHNAVDGPLSFYIQNWGVEMY